MSKNQQQINIREFPLHKMPFNSKIVIIGKPASGKSTLIKDIIMTFAHYFPVAKIFSGSEETNHFYSGLFPEVFIDSDYQDEKLEAFAKRQKLAIRDKSTGVNPHINPKSLLILDDCSSDTKLLNRPIFQKAYKNGRHWEMLFLLALQYGLDVRPNIRTNIDYIFIFREMNQKNLKAIWENYAGIIPDFNDFVDIMHQITGDYTALVIDNRNQSNKTEDCIYYYKARLLDVDKKELCCKEVHKWNEVRYNPNYMLDNM